MRAVATLIAVTATVQQVLAQGSAISASTYNNIIQYTRFARASYAATCATPPNGSVVLNYFTDSATSSSATLFQWDAGKQIVLSFRGTAVPANWNTDLDFPLTALTGTSCSGCQVHEGFQKLHNALAPAAISAVKAAVAKTGYSFVLTGHSLGGALASIATASFGASGIKIAATYTYGEPRNGNSQFGSYALGFVGLANYYRVTHSNDGVPSIPPSAIGFSHHGNEYWEKNSGFNNTQASTVMCASVLNQEPLVGKLSAFETSADINQFCNLGTSSGDNPINYAHVSYSNDVIGNVLHIHDCGASYP
ncbi:hypothetical protein AMS68_003937 [Peltaster fructicola]|uniref:Fungal lipase-type domain-containing protein n=1 Tax=Peltaster fructicola TaxID=286661 RepID=A0A6H0XVE6_9PEZI|nr:hypothetical protein AMS68_003937 [Peltaster fructicola]